jgi:hypothetical protein
MKKIKYQVDSKECIGFIPARAIIEAYLVYKGDSDDGLVLVPSKAKYTYEGKVKTDIGCASLMFAEYDSKNKLWKKKSEDYINLEYKVLSKNKA